MRKITLVMCAMAVTGLSFGQVLNIAKDAPVKDNGIDNYQKVENYKAGGDTLWFTTFNWGDETNERGWTLPDGWAIGDDSGFGMPWTWRDDTLGGNFTNQAPVTWFDTEADGFMAMPVDEYNSVDGVSTDNASDTYFQTPEIDCSNAPSVIVTFYQFFRLCCSDYNLEMMVTNDGGVHWALYDIRFGTAGNTTPPDKFRHPEINITDVAAACRMCRSDSGFMAQLTISG